MLVGVGGLMATEAGVASAQTSTASVLYVASGGNDQNGSNTCTSPSAPCATVIQALSQAGSGATIYVTGTIDEPDTATITSPVTIIGTATPGGPAVIDDTAASGSSVVYVPNPVTANLDDLTLTGGSYSLGAGINIANSGATVNVTDSTISGNTAPNAGGGIYNYGTVDVTDSTISGNIGSNGAGGIYNNNGKVNITDSTISGNDAGSGSGGGTYNYGTVDVTDSTISGNTAGGRGGGIANVGPANVTDSTISGNTAAGGGGGIVNFFGSLDYGHSVFAGNSCVFIAAASDTGGNVTDPASSTCASGSEPTSLTAADLGPLAYNGGPTETIALLVPHTGTNPAIGAVTTGCTATDQRGMPRPTSGCDAGAYQTGTYTPTVAAAPASQSINPGATATVTATLDISGSAAPAGFPVDFSVTGGPDSGQSAAAVTTSSGTATFTVANVGASGTDVISVTSPVAPGASAPGVVTAAAPVEVVVGAPPAFRSAATAYFPWLGADTTFHIQVTGTPTPTVTLTGALPQGLSFDPANDTITGRAGLFALGSHDVTLSAANGTGAPAVQTLDIVIGFAPFVLAPPQATFTVGRPGDLRVLAFAYPTAAITETGTLPAGISLADNGNGTARLSGTPAAGSTGRYPITVTATNPFGASARRVTIDVNGPPPRRHGHRD